VDGLQAEAQADEEVAAVHEQLVALGIGQAGLRPQSVDLVADGLHLGQHGLELGELVGQPGHLVHLGRQAVGEGLPAGELRGQSGLAAEVALRGMRRRGHGRRGYGGAHGIVSFALGSQRGRVSQTGTRESGPTEGRKFLRRASGREETVSGVTSERPGRTSAVRKVALEALERRSDGVVFYFFRVQLGFGGVGKLAPPLGKQGRAPVRFADKRDGREAALRLVAGGEAREVTVTSGARQGVGRG
jgi:hypothetical protein